MSRRPKVKEFMAPIRKGGPGSILSQLFRQIMYDLGLITEERYESLMIRYLQRLERREGKLPLGSTSLSKELLKESITFKTFIRGLDFLNVTQMTFGLRLSFEDKKESEHCIKIDVIRCTDSGTLLASIVRNIFYDLKISNELYRSLINDYIVKSSDVVHVRQIASQRGALVKELGASSVTWKTVLKSICILNVDRFAIILKLEHARGIITDHRLDVMLGSTLGE